MLNTVAQESPHLDLRSTAIADLHQRNTLRGRELYNKSRIGNAMNEAVNSWTDENEAQYDQQIRRLFEEKLEQALQTYGSPLEVGNRLGDVLRELEVEAAKLVVRRSVQKHASPENLLKWANLMADEEMLLDLRKVSTSIANTMRPLAGNKFAAWIAKVLNLAFTQQSIPLLCVTKGGIKQALTQRLVVTSTDGNQRQDYKPDIDIVAVNKHTDSPLAILSAKTTLAERIMQTIVWKRYKDRRLPEELRNIRVYLVTAWEDFRTGTVNRDRVQELDGTYVCNTQAAYYGNIKPFSSLIEDLRALI